MSQKIFENLTIFGLSRSRSVRFGNLNFCEI